MRFLVPGGALVRMTRATKLSADALVPALVLMACSTSADPGNPARAGAVSAAGSPGSTGSAGSPGAAGSPGSPGSPGSAGSPGTGAMSGAMSTVSCSGSSCSVTLTGTGSRVRVLGTTISLTDVHGGRAAVRVDDQDVTCTEGLSAAAGSLTLTCTDVTSDSVTLTVSPG